MRLDRRRRQRNRPLELADGLVGIGGRERRAEVRVRVGVVRR